MSFYWIKTNFLIKWIYRKYVWDIPNQEKKIYITFDDGPIPEITEWVLTQLKNHDAKAAFFCIGNNIEKHPKIFHKIIEEGHAIGNHTFHHMNGWKTNTEEYLDNLLLCEEQIKKFSIRSLQSKLFRPPYGKIKSKQAKKILQLGYKIIMWDILSADFDQNITPEKCLKNILSNIKTGSIIVFHDSVKSFENLEYVLPKTLDFIKKEGYEFGMIS